jgi:cell division protein FtsN
MELRSQILAAESSSGKRMPTYVMVGIPVAVICILAGLVVYERHTEKADERKRAEGLKRWMGSQGPPPSSGKPPDS